MSMVIGQEKLIKYIDSSTFATFPKTVLLIGEEGSGKHTISNYIGNRFGLPVEDITKNLSQDFIFDLYSRPYRSVYLVDGASINTKQEGMLLKFIEDPPDGNIIIIITVNPHLLLPTLYNRCCAFTLEKYTRNMLEKFLTDKNHIEVLEIATTPGQVKEFEAYNIKEIDNLANLIIDKIGVASYPNTLTLTSKFNLGNDTSKLPLNLFMRVLLKCMKNRFLQSNSTPINSLYNITSDFNKKLQLPNINKKHLLDNYFTKLWLEVRASGNK